MTRDQPKGAPPTREAPPPAESKPAPKTDTPPADPWATHCPKCGLLGCRAGHV